MCVFSPFVGCTCVCFTRLCGYGTARVARAQRAASTYSSFFRRRSSWAALCTDICAVRRCVVCSTFRRSCISSFHAWWHHSCTMFCDARVCPVFVCHTAGDSLVFRSVYQLGNHSKLTPECQPRFSSFSAKKCPLAIRVQTVKLMSKTCPRHLRKGLVALIVPNFDSRSQLAAASL